MLGNLSIIITSPGLDLGPDRPRAHAGERGQRAREGAEDELLGNPSCAKIRPF